MNLDELQSVRSKERRTDSLQHLRDSFYADVRDYLAGLKAERNAAAERADDPFASPEVRQLTDEIESAKEVVEAVYERRMGKLVKHASLVAAGMEPDEEGMTAEERELFFDIVDRIRDNKETVLGTIEGQEDATSGASTASPPAEGARAAAAMAGAEDDESAEASERASASDAAEDRSTDRDEPSATQSEGSDADATPTTATSDSSGDAPGSDPEGPDADRAPPSPTERLDADDRVMLRITSDVGEILGVDDRAYDLESEDVVALPRQNAEPLLEREAAERLE
ncbi:MAG: DNA replication factor GINS [Halobacteriales archaeon]|jgi:DNA replication factor GINS